MVDGECYEDFRRNMTILLHCVADSACAIQLCSFINYIYLLTDLHAAYRFTTRVDARRPAAPRVALRRLA